MKTGILFDLDGTLLDSLGDLHRCTNYVLRQYGCPERSVEEIRRFVGNGARRLVEQALPGLDTDPSPEQVLADYMVYYQENCKDTTRPYPGITEALTQLGKDYPMAVVSNKPHEAVAELCRMFFPGVYGLGTLPDCPRKPAPDMLQKAMQQIGVERCIYVGDSEVDVLTAKNAGVPCLSVLWGFRDRDELERAGAEHFCQDTAQLPEALRALLTQLG